jgi:hypothetical protein
VSLALPAPTQSTNRTPKGVNAMLALTLGSLVLDQIIQWRYGVAGTLALGAVTVGHKAGNVTLVCVGLAAMALLVAR